MGDHAASHARQIESNLTMGKENLSERREIPNPTHERKSTNAKIYGPGEFSRNISPKQTASIFSNLLDSVYGGMSDTSDGHPVDKFEKMILAGEMFPFIAYDGETPIGCCAWTWRDSLMSFGNACVLPTYRGDSTKIRGSDLYSAADNWLEETMQGRYVRSHGGFRLPESAAVAINKSDWYPTWIAPLASWGYPDEPLTEPGRNQEFLILGEKYQENSIKIPDVIYIPTRTDIGDLVQNAWNSLAEYSGQIIMPTARIIETKNSSPFLFKVNRGNEERIWLDCTTDNDLDGLDINEIKDAAFRGTLTDQPKTRLVFVGVPSEDPKATSIQDMLIDEGFIFSGIVPGIREVEYTDIKGDLKTYTRKSLNVYSALRPDVQSTLNRPPQMRFRNLGYQRQYDSIVENWFND